MSAISLITTAAAVVIARRTARHEAAALAAPGLAAGVMLWLGLAEVAPESSAAIGRGPTAAAMLGGAVLVVVATRIAHRPTVAAGVAPVIGVALVLHDLPEGFAVGALLGSTGLVAALPAVVAVAAHNLPEKLAFVAPAGTGAAPTAGVLAAATLPEPLGAALAGIGTAARPETVPLVVAVAGGMMLAVAVGTLPTLARRARTWRPFLGGGAVGALSMAGLGVVLG